MNEVTIPEHPSRSAPKCVNCEFYTCNAEAFEKYKKQRKSLGMLGIRMPFPSSHCVHKSLPVSLTNGSYLPRDAWDMREEGAACGPEGKLFEQETYVPPEPVIVTPDPKAGLVIMLPESPVVTKPDLTPWQLFKALFKG